MKDKFFIIKEDSVSDILKRVLEANMLLDSGKCRTVKTALEKVGISKSTFYKYKDSIRPFKEAEDIYALCIETEEHQSNIDILKIIEKNKINMISSFKAKENLLIINIKTNLVSLTKLLDVLKQSDMKSSFYKIKL